MVYYYKKKIPAIDDIVIAIVDKISEYGIEVTLSEYNGIKGFINCSEVSRKKRVNLNKLLTVGKDVLLHVIQIDEEKKHIDLSKRTIGEEDIKIFGIKHKLHIQLYNIFKQFYMKITNITNLEKINEDNLYEFMCGTLFQIQNEFENEYIMEKILNKETNNEILDVIDFDRLIELFDDEGLVIDLEKFKLIVNEYIDTKINRVKPQSNETIKLMTYSSTGLEDLKYSLNYKSFSFYNDILADFDIKINYISGSIYLLIVEQKDFELKGTLGIDDVLTLVKTEIKNRATEKQIQNQIII